MKRSHPDDDDDSYVPLSRVQMKTNEEGRIEENTDIYANGTLLSDFDHRVRVCIKCECVAELDNRNVSATIGRSRVCDIRVDHPTVSSLHCCLVMKLDGLHIVDLRSSNGTFVGTGDVSRFRRVSKNTSILLQNEDTIRLDTVECRVYYES